MEKINIEIIAKVTATVELEEGETIEQFKERYVDIYLNGTGKNSHLDKQDLGVDEYTITVL